MGLLYKGGQRPSCSTITIIRVCKVMGFSVWFLNRI